MGTRGGCDVRTRIGTTLRAGVGVVLVVLALGVVARAEAQDAGRQELARELARLLLDDGLRRGLNEEVSAGLTQALGATLQDRLNRRLLEMEWRILAGIVRRFVAETLPPSRMEEIAAQAYARHFDEAELGELLRFQRSDVGRKAARLTPVIASESARAIDEEIQTSPVMPRMLEELQRAFPVLGPPESP